MSKPPQTRGLLAIPLAFALLELVLQVTAITNYGWFRDELYYVACSKHLAWGYVDQPPLSIALLALWRGLFGESLVAMRCLPALAGAGTVFVTGVLAAKLGGGRFAQAVACLCALFAPVYLALDHYFSMNSLDLLFWTVAALIVARILENPRPRDWMVLGVVLGLGLLNKASMLWFGGALVLGLLLTPHRRLLAGRWPWIAAAIALAMLVPHVVWQVHNDWPTLEFMRHATQEKMVHTSFGEFWKQQLLVMGPAMLPVWIAGLVWLCASSRWRIFAIVYLAVAALLVSSGSSRPNYLCVAYAPLFAAGGVALERFSARGWRTRLRPVAIGWLVLAGGAIVPLALPLLAPQTLIRYQQALHVKPKAQENTEEGKLGQFFADMFGWEELAERVARVYRSLPEAERAQCGIYCTNYGEAGAIDRFGAQYGLPPALSGHNNYWLWGTHGCTGAVMIVVGGRPEDTHPYFQSSTLADTTDCEYAMPYENGAAIWICRGLEAPLEERWPALRHYR
ncbi:MAG: glycosyltransferase family 39 protein [Planctomycetes bacterium]|nr:glycosyltransferase family 39 protein [Planctomycetota bacterium]